MKTKNSKVTELELVTDVYKRLKKKSTCMICREVPLLGRYADIVYLNRKLLISIEFKLKDWRRALVQARDHLLGVDYAYICMPKRTITASMEQLFEDAGVGLIFYKEKGRWPFEVAIKASKSLETWSAARSRVYEFIQSNQK